MSMVLMVSAAAVFAAVCGALLKRGQKEIALLFSLAAAVLVTVSVLLACIVFSGCAGRTVITDAQFKSACEAADCEVKDVSDQFDSSVITKALTVSGDDYSLGFFTFASTDSAKTNYAQMLSSVKTSEGKAVDSSEYNRYTYKGDDLTTVLYRNGTTILFATGADKDTVNKVVTALGL